MNTDHLQRGANTLEQAVNLLSAYAPTDELYDVFRNAAIKSFELGLESGGNALRRALKAYLGSARAADALSFNDVIRHSAKHGIITAEEAQSWLEYRTNRNTTAHDYGERFANETLILLPSFANDLRHIAVQLQSAE